MAKVAFTGSRLLSADFDLLDGFRIEYNITNVLVGDATGVDADVYFWAKQRDIRVRRFIADWTTGKLAGHRRNQQMIDNNPRLLIAFPGGNGTADMVGRARGAGIEVVHVGKR